MEWRSWFSSSVEAKSPDDSVSKPNESSKAENASDSQSTRPSFSKTPSDEGTYYGFDYYPERRAGKGDTSFGTKVIQLGKAKQDLNRTKCEKEVYRNIKESKCLQ